MYLEKLKEINPLVICLTNDVVKNFTANGLLAIGASPAMSESEEDLVDLLKGASALLVNIGSITSAKWQVYQKAIRLANLYHVPVILDPVAAGASRFRLEVCLDLLTHYDITLLRGNASEIAALIGEKQESKGADGGPVEDISALVRKASQHFKLPVIATGPVDAIASNNHVRLIQNGSPLMPLVTGTGCLLGAVLAAFIGLSEEKDDLDCLSEAMLTYNIAGELAQEQVGISGPGSFQVAFLDSLYQIENKQIEERQRITND